MRNIYLIRHGQPDFPDGAKMCLGTTDVPLGRLGRMQSALLGAELMDAGITEAFCSRLKRARQTADYLGVPVTEVVGLEEMYAGDWDGLTFDEIRERWPELYARRGKDRSITPPGAEDRTLGCARFMAAFGQAVKYSRGDIAVVSHSSTEQALLCTVLGLPLERGNSLILPYGSITMMGWEDGSMLVGDMGVVPAPELDRSLCMALLDAAGTPENVVRHCVAVSDAAMRIVCALAQAGVCLNEYEICAAALLHDVCRDEPDHARRGAELLNALGYARTADLIARHHSGEIPEEPDEAAVVALADKLVLGDRPVTIEERFRASEAKCATPEALAEHGKRLAAAIETARMINAACGRDAVAV